MENAKKTSGLRLKKTTTPSLPEPLGRRVFYRLKPVTEKFDSQPVLQIERVVFEEGGHIIENVDKPDVKIMVLAKLSELMTDSALTENLR